MNIARRPDDIQFDRNSVVTVGSFDGVHLAHQAVLKAVVQRAHDRAGRSVAVTFEPHPKQVLVHDGAEITLLTTLDERIALCEEEGLDLLYVLDFTYDFSRQGFGEFYKRYVIEGVGVSEVIEGYDHHFGRDREGSVRELLAMGNEFGFSVTAMKPITVDDEVVSSTKIRQYLLEGNVERAEVLLGRPYSVKGRVVRGNARGKSLGFPTANIELPVKSKLTPQNGIYFVSVSWGGGTFYGMCSIGVRPTFEPLGGRTIEINVLDFHGDLYGEDLHVQFLRRLRDEKKFDSVQELIDQMNRDKVASLALSEEYSKVLTGLKQKRVNR